MRHYDRLVSLVVSYVNGVGITVLLLLIFVTTADVIGRYMRHPIPGAFELVEMGLCVAVFFGMAYTGLRRGHISVDWFFERIPKRKKLVLGAINSVLEAFCWVLIAWQGYTYAMRTSMVVTDTLGINLTFIKLMVPFGALLMILVVISQFAGSVRQATNQESQGEGKGK